ncbi:hypothetical protein B0H21DRAFT_741687 [Amylocystis lapponica]|nr:hypothetical protein B0H21DRAFT_741687 [Amylocystis lapponica]
MSDFLDLKITQTWRGKDANGRIYDLHWALTIQTGGDDDAPIGTIHNAVGNMDTFFYEKTYDAVLKNNNWRGALVVGNIPQDKIPELEDILAHNPVVRHSYEWNCQNWVHTALRELRMAGFDIKPITWETIRTQMWALLDDWESGEI